jgi:hypothetical protein
MKQSLAQRIFNSKKPFVLYHTHIVREKVVKQAINESKSIDLDISIDSEGKQYIGHTAEYYQINGKTRPNCMAFDKAIEMIAKAHIPVIVDCKHHGAWPIIEEVVGKIGAYRCMVHTFASELKFSHDLSYDYDCPIEWSPISKLQSLKNRFPNVTTTISCKFLPVDLLVSDKYSDLLGKIRQTLVENQIDTLCLNVPDKTMVDNILEFFLLENILPHVGIDNIDQAKLSKVYVGKTDILEDASDCRVLGFE